MLLLNVTSKESKVKSTNCIGKMCIHNIDEAFLWIVPIIAEFHLSEEEVSNCIYPKFTNQIIWLKSIP